MCNSLRHFGLQPTRLLCPWDSPGKDPGVGCHALLQGIFPTRPKDRMGVCYVSWQAARFFTTTATWETRVVYVHVYACICVYGCVHVSIYVYECVRVCVCVCVCVREDRVTSLFFYESMILNFNTSKKMCGERKISLKVNSRAIIKVLL